MISSSDSRFAPQGRIRMYKLNSSSYTVSYHQQLLLRTLEPGTLLLSADRYANYSLVFISPVAAEQVIVYFLGFADSTLLS